MNCPYCCGEGIYHDQDGYEMICNFCEGNGEIHPSDLDIDEEDIEYGVAGYEQIGDHKGDKKLRSRTIRRVWKSNKKILPNNRYGGYD